MTKKLVQTFIAFDEQGKEYTIHKYQIYIVATNMHGTTKTEGSVYWETEDGRIVNSKSTGNYEIVLSGQGPAGNASEIGSTIRIKHSLDHLERQLHWVKSLSGGEQIAAGCVVVLQGISTTLNELVARLNEVNLANARLEEKRHREMHIKKIIIGMFYEMGHCFNKLCGLLNTLGKQTDEIKSKKKVFEDAIGSVEKTAGNDMLKNIRNKVAFHFCDYLDDPEALVKTYWELESISIGQLETILTAGHDCMNAIKRKLLW